MGSFQLAHNPSSSNKLDDQNDQREHKQDVDEAAQGITAHHPEKPKNEQDHDQGPQHRHASIVFFF
jgi:hypothetical protein